MQFNEGDYWLDEDTYNFYVYKKSKWFRLVTVHVPEEIENIVRNIVAEYYTNLYRTNNDN